MKKAIATLILFFITTSSFADLATTLGRFVGYTIVASKTITGWYDPDESKKGDSFEGCNYNRVIVFDDNKILTCAEYGYQYAYRPTAIILFNGTNFKMLVGDDVYDMSR